MTRRHSSFLLRCWDLGGDGERIEIEHVQTGTKTLVHSVGAALEWICVRSSNAGQDVLDAPAPAGDTTGGGENSR